MDFLIRVDIKSKVESLTSHLVSISNFRNEFGKVFENDSNRLTVDGSGEISKCSARNSEKRFESHENKAFMNPASNVSTNEPNNSILKHKA